jgi:hypothetical protein
MPTAASRRVSERDSTEAVRVDPLTAQLRERKIQGTPEECKENSPGVDHKRSRMGNPGSVSIFLPLAPWDDRNPPPDFRAMSQLKRGSRQPEEIKRAGGAKNEIAIAVKGSPSE